MLRCESINCGMLVISFSRATIRRGANPEAAFRVDVGGWAMTIWELWAGSGRQRCHLPRKQEAWIVAQRIQALVFG